MQLTKPTFSLFAEDFELMKAKLSSDEIVAIFSALSDLCLWGECEYTPQNQKQEYFWEKLKTKFDYDLSSYKASVENGKKGAKYGVLGGRPKKTITPKETPIKTPTITPEETPSCHLSLDNYTLESCQKKENTKEKYDALFAEFWSAYPKQRAGSKEKALKAYIKAIDERKAEPPQILNACKCYAESREVLEGYAKGCAAWLNDDRYLCDYGQQVKTDNGDFYVEW